MSANEYIAINGVRYAAIVPMSKDASGNTVTDSSGAPAVNALTYETGLIAGERNVDSSSNGYQVVRQECNVSIISKTTIVTIGDGGAGDTHLMGIMIHTALTGTLVIAGFADSDGTAKSYTFPAATPAGFYNFYGAINSAGALQVTASNAGDDDKIMVFWKAV